jgi:hypothetical protein
VSYFAYFKITDMSLGEAEEVIQDYSNYTLGEFWAKYLGAQPYTRKEILNVKREIKQYMLQTGRFI